MSLAAEDMNQNRGSDAQSEHQRRSQRLEYRAGRDKKWDNRAFMVAQGMQA